MGIGRGGPLLDTIRTVAGPGKRIKEFRKFVEKAHMNFFLTQNVEVFSGFATCVLKEELLLHP